MALLCYQIESRGVRDQTHGTNVHDTFLVLNGGLVLLCSIFQDFIRRCALRLRMRLDMEGLEAI